jgi:hypothetical protein
MLQTYCQLIVAVPLCACGTRVKFRDAWYNYEFIGSVPYLAAPYPIAVVLAFKLPLTPYAKNKKCTHDGDNATNNVQND